MTKISLEMKGVEKLLLKWGLAEHCLHVAQSAEVLSPGKYTHKVFPQRRGFYFFYPGDNRFRTLIAAIESAKEQISTACKPCPFYGTICIPEATAIREGGMWRSSVMPVGRDGKQDVRKYNISAWRRL